MKYKHLIIYIFLLFIVIDSCTTKFVPEIDEYDNIIVVEGLLTDEYRTNHVKLSRTLPIGITGISSPLVDAYIYVQDDLNRVGIFEEKVPGYYTSDSLSFRGEICYARYT